MFACIYRCTLGKNEEECIVGMGSSNISLHKCCMQSSMGPAIDMSQSARLHMSQSTVQDCVGKLSCRPA